MYILSRSLLHSKTRLMLQRAQNCNSSSDENRSSGHASMSDNGHSSPQGNYSSGNDRLTAGVMQKALKNRVSGQHSRSRHRATPARVPKLYIKLKLKYFLNFISYMFLGQEVGV